jgi:hypothetical protein
MTTNTTSAAHKPRRIPLVPILIAAAFVAGIVGASKISTALSSQTVAWGLSAGIGGPAFDPATAQAMTVVNVEVQWPACVNAGDSSWLTPEVSYMPWSVTITLRTSAAYAEKCSKGADGQPAVIGYYLSDLSFPVRLSEPLGGRPLFDGSTVPATERYRP